MYLLETANIMFLSFIRFELLSFEMLTPYHTKCEIYFCGSFVRIQSSFLSHRGTRFPSHLFPHILSIFGKPHLFSWERLDSSIFVCTSEGQKSRVEVSSCSCHLK